MIRSLLRSRTVQFFLLATAGYWFVGSVLTPNTSNLEFENMVRTAVAVAVSVAYMSVCVEALLVRTPDRVQQLSLGIVLAWGSTVLSSFWILLYRYGGRPGWMLDANIYGYFVFLQILGGVLHITAPGAAGGGIPRRNWIALGVTTGLGVLIGLSVWIWEPNTHSLVDTLELHLRSQPAPYTAP